ncbi:cytochrome c oxidase assembly protein [Streptomyces sp. RK62]|nr:cytochrome c oxidase assembly protein [Streptomyces sp. RK62]
MGVLAGQRPGVRTAARVGRRVALPRRQAVADGERVGDELLVTARPLTLALRALPAGGVRRSLLALTRVRAAGWLTFPPLAALWDVGGLWLLYRTGLFAQTAHRPALHLLVHVHVLAAGTLFAFAVCGLDPVRRRWSAALRGGTLLVAGAAHGVLAKTLYAAPPPGLDVATADLRTGAQVMYYGGDLVALATAVVVGAGWYAARGRALRAATRRRGGGVRPAEHPALCTEYRVVRLWTDCRGRD